MDTNGTIESPAQVLCSPDRSGIEARGGLFIRRFCVHVGLRPVAVESHVFQEALVHAGNLAGNSHLYNLIGDINEI